jgi:hypothetical protein
MELGKTHTYTDARSQKIQEPQNKTNMMKIYIKDSLTLLENTYIPIQKIRWEQQIPSFTCLFPKETNKKTKKTHTHHMLLTFTLFAARKKLRKPATPQPVAGKLKGSHTTRLL